VNSAHLLLLRRGSVTEQAAFAAPGPLLQAATISAVRSAAQSLARHHCKPRSRALYASRAAPARRQA